MMRSLGLWAVASFAAANLAMAGCSRSWPTVRAVGDPAFMARKVPINSIDILPIDVEIGTYQGASKEPREVAAVFYGQAENTLVQGLQARGYLVGAWIDRTGAFSRTGFAPGYALTEEQVIATEQSLALYAAAQAQRPNELLFPYLPARLGTATGSDATLYIGGYGYAGKDPSHVSVGKVVLVVLVVAVVAVIVIAAVAGKGGGGSVGSGVANAAGNAASAAGHAIEGVGRAALHVTGAVARVGVQGLDAAGRALANGNIQVDGGCCASDPYYDYYYDPYYDGVDAYGHSRASMVIVVPVQEAQPSQAPPVTMPAPQPAPQPVTQAKPVIPEMPKKGRSKTYLEMTLVDNRTGKVLWHARQIFNANPGKEGDAREVIKRMLRTLPARAGI